MSKNPNRDAKSSKRDEPLNGAMKLFLSGCVAELYLLVIRRFYISGTVDQLLACYAALLYLAIAGAVVLAIGLAVALSGKKHPKQARLGWSIFSAGAFLGLSSLMIRLLGGSALTLLCVVVPVVMLLGILWHLYDRECAWSLTILAVSLIVLWICRHLLGGGTTLGTLALAGAVVYLVLLAVAAFLTRKADHSGGLVGKIRVLPATADALPIYVACGLSFLAVVVALFSSTVAYYAMWALALVVFVLAVYYTVKQL